MLSNFEKLNNNNHIMLTPNKRSCHFFTNKFKEYRIKKFLNISDIQFPIYCLSDWIDSLWKKIQIKYYPSYKYLSSFAQQLVWEKIIFNSNFGKTLFKLNLAGKNAIRAYKYYKEWGISFAEIESFADLNIDVKAFVDWVIAYEKICEENCWVDSSKVLELIVKAINDLFSCDIVKKNNNENHEIIQIIPDSISLTGFIELSPKYKEIFSSLEKNGCDICFDEINFNCDGIYKTKVGNFKQEIFIAGQWANLQVNKLNRKNIAVVVPNLENVRDKVISEFSKTFDGFEYNVSAPYPITKYPLVESGLSVLQLLKRKIEINLISYILRSPFINIADISKFELLRVELFLRKFKKKEFFFQEFITKLEFFLYSESNDKFDGLKEDTSQKKSTNLNQEVAIDDFYIDKNLNELEIFFTKIKEVSSNLDFYNNKKYLPSEWIVIFEKLLNIFGWPGDRKLNSIEQQLLESWQNTLKDFNEIDFAVGKISYNHALNILSKLSTETLFLPQTEKHVKINVLGTLEAIGMPFDAIWVTGFSDNNWPSESNPTPFLPLQLQIKYNIPRSSPRRELLIANKITQAFKNSCNYDLIFSYSDFDGENQQRESNLIFDVPFKNLNEIFFSKDENLQKLYKDFYNLNIEHLNLGKIYLELINDKIGPELTLQEHEKLNQGSRILQLQANCPFRAFSEIRLNAKSLDIPEANISKAERGEIVHQVLAMFWQKVKNKNTLDSINEQELKNVIIKIIELVFANWQAKKSKTLPLNFLQLEQQRLLNLILDWLIVEKQRENFTVNHIEKTTAVNIGPLNLKLRVDRIDKLDDGTYVLIDYKTSNLEISNWFGNRPLEPQLPLYTSSSKLNFSAITFGVLSANEKKYKGIANKDEIIPNVLHISKARIKDKQDNWEAQLSFWKNNLAKIATEFFAGNAEVDPKDINLSCRFCELKPVCRIIDRD